MTNTRKPENMEEEKIMQANIQKRFKDMFSGKNQPLSNMSLQDVEALKERVAELEATLKESESSLPIPVGSVVDESTNTVEPHASTIESTSEQAAPERGQARGTFFRDLLRAPKFEDIAKTQIANLQHRILMGLFVVSWLSIALLIWSWSDTTPTSLGVVLFANALFALASFWQRRGYIERASWILVGTIYIILVFS